MSRRVLVLAVAVALAMGCSTFVGAAGKPVTLTIMTEANPGDDMNNDPVTTLAEKLTGYNLEFQMLPTEPAQRQQKLNLMLASGEVVDIVKMSSIDMAKQMIPQGYFAALDDLLKQVGTNILKNTSARWFAPVIGKARLTEFRLSARPLPISLAASIERTFSQRLESQFRLPPKSSGMLWSL